MIYKKVRLIAKERDLFQTIPWHGYGSKFICKNQFNYRSTVTLHIVVAKLAKKRKNKDTSNIYRMSSNSNCSLPMYTIYKKIKELNPN